MDEAGCEPQLWTCRPSSVSPPPPLAQPVTIPARAQGDRISELSQEEREAEPGRARERAREKEGGREGGREVISERERRGERRRREGISEREEEVANRQLDKVQPLFVAQGLFAT